MEKRLTMKLDDELRCKLFAIARKLHPDLGDLFQNPMNITSEDLQQEIDEQYRLRANELKRWQAYHNALGVMLCFPDEYQKHIAELYKEE